ncbi:MsnO8 family LLM class oxidoreductase [Paenibacillus solani]|uniref:Luciferase n=1 Tax=Paenibacillus solani TaxID=1705565 RepID=A0A0M1NKW0_9BACL|nr:MsnO8 family LLM class oxidoreductase [Paenibacillus solani]KOR82514.1 luciferase [Paenibacillus solani]
MNNQLKLSVLDLVPHLGESSFEEALQQAVTLAQHAEAWGYGRYWVAEHHDLEHLSCASPEILLSHIGARTTSIRLGSGAVLLPHYSPLKVAENFRMLAALYPGRIDLGIGRAPGGSAHTSMALSGNFLGHVADLPQRIRSLTELLEDRYRYEDVPVAAKPVPATQPVMWMLGTNTKGVGYASEFGMGYVFGQFMSDADGAEILRSYKEGFQPSAHLQEPRAMVAVSVVCAMTQEEAEKLAADIPQTGQRTVAAEPMDKTTVGQDQSLDLVPKEQEGVHRVGVSRSVGRRDTTPAGDGYSQREPSEETRGSQVASDVSRSNGIKDTTSVGDGHSQGVPDEGTRDSKEVSIGSTSTSAGPSKKLIVGTPASVRSRLQELAEQYGCDEFLIVTPVSDYQARLESYRLLMEQE